MSGPTSATDRCRCGRSLKHGCWWNGTEYLCAVCAAEYYTRRSQKSIEDYRRQFEEDEE